MSLLTPPLQARRCSVICHTIFSVSLRTWIASLTIHECLRRNETWNIFPGCVSIIFCFWLSVNSLSSPANGYSERRWPMANVGVHSYISTKKLQASFCILWLCKYCILSHMQRWYHWATFCSFFFFSIFGNSSRGNSWMLCNTTKYECQ